MKKNNLLIQAIIVLALSIAAQQARAQTSPAVSSEKGIKRTETQARVEGAPIKGVIVKGGWNGGPRREAMAPGNPIPGVVIKGGIVESTFVRYEDNTPFGNEALLHYLGVNELVIEKGEYAFDNSSNKESRVILHLYKENIVHRDIAARSQLFEGANPDGATFTYTVELVYVDGVAKDLLVTYKGFGH